MNKKSAFFRGFLACVAFLPLLARADDFSRENWLADLDQLQSLLATNYPSLEWQARRGVDLPGILARARTQVGSAKDDAEARAAIDRFLSRFGDGHLSIEWDTSQPDPADDSTLPDCERFGFRDGDPDTRAIAPLIAGYEDITPKGGTVGAGFINVDGQRVGVLRVALFMPARTHCEQFLRMRSAVSKPSSNELEAYEEAIGNGATNLFLAEIEERLRQLAARQPAAILVDGAGNGGGNNSAIALARLLGGEGVRNPRLLYVREPIRAGNLATRAAELRTELRKAPKRERAYADPMLATLEAGKAAAEKPCDLMPLWKGETVSCSNRVEGPFYASGLVESEVPAEWLGKSWAKLVSDTVNYDPRPRVWRGPVIVLVDERSASATELFAAMLQDSKAALVIGAPTFGAGCGWTMGKYESSKILTHSRARLVMPDCTRIRADGSDELDGIQPDLLIGIRRPDTQKQRAERVAARLSEALKMVGVR